GVFGLRSRPYTLGVSRDPAQADNRQTRTASSAGLRLVIGIALLIALPIIMTGWGRYQWLNAPLDMEPAELTYEIPSGSSFARVSNELAELGIIEHPRLFSWYARLSGQAGSIRAGEYLLRDGTTPLEILEQFVDGDVQLYSFTIVEGWTFEELMAALSTSEILKATLTYEDWPALLEQLGVEEDESPEGWFLPETYRFPRGTTDAELLTQAHELLRDVLDAEWARRRDGLPLKSPYEALTLASIVEKETALAAERPRIAGVFVRRLQQRMRLQTDPTVIYGVIYGLGEDFDGNLTRRHLRADNPYNTYTRHGLPPGPIALPGQAAIRAALQPQDGTELYFVATGLGDGSHKFSTTREEHEAAVAEYLARERAARDGE
ncbi:MAG: endolytic transglycosylase MltG, partial [Pseudomonadota bacterium]